MKPTYTDQDAADEDDVELRQQIALGNVPPGCLRMGQAVRRTVEGNKDPCSMCPTDRARCGGREQTRTFEGWRSDRTPTRKDEVGAHAMLRSEQIEILRQICGIGE
jgi:hypothetical protein